MQLTIQDLRNMATEQSFQKGINYYEMNLVNNPTIDGNTIKAKVSGSSYPYYEVEIDVDNPYINYCSCPYDWGGICKHIVALGLYWCNHKKAFKKVKKEKDKLKNELKQLFATLDREDLIDILNELIYENQYIKSKILDYIQDKGKMTDKLYLEKLENLKSQSLNIIKEFNQYGGGSTDKENYYFECIKEIKELIIDTNISSYLRQEIINEFMKEYLKDNSGLDDPTLDLIFSTAQNKDDWKLIIQKLEESNSKFDQELVMNIYLNQLDNEEKYLKLRKQYLEYGMDYYKLACFYRDIGQKEKAVQTALNGEKEGQGRIIDNITFLKKYYKKQNNYQKTMEYSIKEFKDSPSFKKYLSILDYCKKDNENKIKNNLINYLTQSNHLGTANILASIYEYQDNYKKILELVQKNKIYPDKYKDLLINKFPHKMIDYYKQEVQNYIDKKKRSSYNNGANVALNIKKIYTEILKSNSEWEKYMQNILDNYPRHKALQEEFRSICLN
ncbi:MAG: hypothetical protein R6V14_09015 [Halanaerobiales bacterium]